MSDKEKIKINLHFGNKVLPAYLTERGNVVRMILFTTFFSLLFINIFRPFNSESWLPHMTSYDYFKYGSILVLIGMVVISLSRVMMSLAVKRVSIGTIEYFSWLFVEIIILAALYVLIAYEVGFIERFMNEHKPPLTMSEAVFSIFKKAAANTSCMLAIPYIISVLYLNNEDLKRQLRDSRQGIEAAEKDYLQFRDDRGEIRISIMSDNIIYLESSDNYVTIKYLKNNVLSDFILRNSLKKVADGLVNTSIQRCHRSFMVNFEHIMSLKKNNGEIFFEFDVQGIKEIPVSKTYNDQIVSMFMKYSHHE